MLSFSDLDDLREILNLVGRDFFVSSNAFNFLFFILSEKMFNEDSPKSVKQPIKPALMKTRNVIHLTNKLEKDF